MRAVITVIGKDMVGILAQITASCATHGINVLEVTQSILQDVFAMIMLVDLTKSNIRIADLSEEFNELGRKMGLSIHVMHEDVFNSMHRI